MTPDHKPGLSSDRLMANTSPCSEAAPIPAALRRDLLKAARRLQMQERKTKHDQIIKQKGWRQ